MKRHSPYSWARPWPAVRPLVAQTFQKRRCKAPRGDRTHDRTLTKRMLCHLGCRGAWCESAHHSSENTPLRQACCERHCYSIANLATPRVAGPRVFPNSWHTVPKHAGNNTDALHRTAEHRLQRGSNPRGQSRTEGIRAPASRARLISIPSPHPLGRYAAATSTQLSTANFTGTHHRQGS
jgi:hypothetical protein